MGTVYAMENCHKSNSIRSLALLETVRACVHCGTRSGPRRTVTPKYPSPLSPTMSVVDQPFNIYREHLSSLHHGVALWDPNPVKKLHKNPNHVSIGDVGYLDSGAFIRMFNVTLPWNDPSNKLLGTPDEYERIKPKYLNFVRSGEIREGEYYSPHVSKVDNVGAE